MATLANRLEDAYFRPEPDPEPQMARLRDELAALPEPRLRQLLMEFGAQVCSSGVPEEDLYAFWEKWDLPKGRVAETSGRGGWR